MVLANQYDLPFVKLLAVEGARQSLLKLFSHEQKYSVKEEGVRYKVFYIDDMLIDRNIQNNAITEHAILKKAALKNLPHIAHLLGVYIGVTHIAFSIPEYDMDFRDYLYTNRDPKHLPKIIE